MIRSSSHVISAALVIVVVWCSDTHSTTDHPAAPPHTTDHPRGFGELMPEVGRHFERAGRAASAHRWELAQYDIDELQEIFEQDVPSAVPAPRGSLRRARGRSRVRVEVSGRAARRRCGARRGRVRDGVRARGRSLQLLSRDGRPSLHRGALDAGRRCSGADPTVSALSESRRHPAGSPHLVPTSALECRTVP